MSKKKSFISLLLFFCMIIPAMFIISACGATVETTVTAEQWQKALKFEGETDYYYKRESSLYTIEYKLNATSASLLQTTKSDNSIKNKWICLVEGEGDEQALYKYQYNKDGTYTKTEQSIKPENIAVIITSTTNKSYSAMLTAFDLFEYDEEIKAYVSKTPVTCSGVLSDVTLKFENGKLVYVEQTYGDADEYTDIVEITYGNTVVDQLPANIADLLK